jgi:hypothetical protein
MEEFQIDVFKGIIAIFCEIPENPLDINTVSVIIIK